MYTSLSYFISVVRNEYAEQLLTIFTSIKLFIGSNDNISVLVSHSVNLYIILTLRIKSNIHKQTKNWLLSLSVSSEVGW